ncbi:YdcF family protein [Magnetospira sp. QH-2]|uniref:YdcF family protein n=1 Tax=Magnetospira sp. (strain QH-2) TaxID=1288970 RepID=UPI00130E999F|nr:YdcF family protein [Magnetospira sp. QH-2]
MQTSPEAIVVLGASVLPDGSPSAALRRRVGVAVRCYNNKGPLPLIMSGGAVSHAIPESHVMRDLALAAGVPAEFILVEDRSRSTWENAHEVRLIAKERGWSHLLLVSDRFHLPRAKDMFRRHGLTVSGAPVDRAPGDSRIAWAIAHGREVLSWVKHAYLSLVLPPPDKDF